MEWISTDTVMPRGDQPVWLSWRGCATVTLGYRCVQSGDWYEWSGWEPLPDAPTHWLPCDIPEAPKYERAPTISLSAPTADHKLTLINVNGRPRFVWVVYNDDGRACVSHDWVEQTWGLRRGDCWGIH